MNTDFIIPPYEPARDWWIENKGLVDKNNVGDTFTKTYIIKNAPTELISNIAIHFYCTYFDNSMAMATLTAYYKYSISISGTNNHSVKLLQTTGDLQSKWGLINPTYTGPLVENDLFSYVKPEYLIQYQSEDIKQNKETVYGKILDNSDSTTNINLDYGKIQVLYCDYSSKNPNGSSPKIYTVAPNSLTIIANNDELRYGYTDSETSVYTVETEPRKNPGYHQIGWTTSQESNEVIYKCGEIISFEKAVNWFNSLGKSFTSARMTTLYTIWAPNVYSVNLGANGEAFLSKASLQGK